MSDSYTSSKIKEALVASQGSRARAQDILLGWAQADDRLLRGLVEPYLKGIVTGTIERVTKPAAEKGAAAVQAPAQVRAPVAKVPVPKPGPPRELSPEALGESAFHDGAGSIAAAPQSGGGSPKSAVAIETRYDQSCSADAGWGQASADHAGSRGALCAQAPGLSKRQAYLGGVAGAGHAGRIPTSVSLLP